MSTSPPQQPFFRCCCDLASITDSSRNSSFSAPEKLTWEKAAGLTDYCPPAFFPQALSGCSQRPGSCTVCRCPKQQGFLPSGDAYSKGRGLAGGERQQCQQVLPLRSGKCSWGGMDRAPRGPNTSPGPRKAGSTSRLWPHPG